MKENNEDRIPGEGLDRALDAALAKYVSAEPRVGLEPRVLANLRTVEARQTDRTWWNWSIPAAVAGVLIVAATLALQRSKPAHPPAAVHPSVPRTRAGAATELAKRERNYEAVRQRQVQRRVRYASQHAITAGNPKLDVFPSPRPLSEQEELLAIYAGQYPEHAALVALARMDDLQHEDEERQEIAAGERDQKQ